MSKAKKAVKSFLDEKTRSSGRRSAQLLESAEYISFDIFDTLIVRDVAKPTDVFRLMGKQLKFPDFSRKRIEAEQKARKKKNGGEVNIRDIYRSFAGISEKDAERFCMQELSYEMLVCRPNPALIGTYKKCLKNKKVILVSDMYLPSEMMEKILAGCGIKGYEKLYVSCDVGASKRDGGLYGFVLKDLGIRADEMVHIGNDAMADYICARKCGISAVKTKTGTENMYLGNIPEKQSRKSGGFSDIYRLINTTTGSTKRFRNFYYRFGYENFGILLLGFTKWMMEDLRANGIKQVIFLARDGYIMKEVYDLLGYSSEIPSRYMEMSRRSIRTASSFSQPQTYENALSLMILPSRISVRQIFDCWGLTAEDFMPQLREAEIDINEVFWSKLLKQEQRVRKLYGLVDEAIIKNASAEKQTMLEYIRGFDLDKKTALVDIGYGANIQKELIKALLSHGMDPDITGYYLGLDQRAKKNTDGISLKIKGYIWDNYNRRDTVYEEKPFVGLFEAPFLEQNGSVKKYVRAGDRVIAERYEYEYLSEIGEVDEISCVREIQDGALDLIRQAKQSRFSDIEPSSRDAFFLMRYCMMRPSKSILDHFYNFRFFNGGESSFLAKPQHDLLGYMLHPRQLKSDFYASSWKIGFFKYLLKVDMSYETLWRILKIFFPSEKI
ncbi:HAD family hydrolase [Ruminococcus flavefaciens]|uniref:Hydrolase n=1 Tax=Ruminococcus flavefaciens 007c TaxID=1341157 RepID=W7UVX6_RUMFL|nr:hypothetical protein [Ruminococcus flavefaciens]EWM53020.1 hypothetical protein RF007C_15520 [Ruminococcus flavefaciens 007c]